MSEFCTVAGMTVPVWGQALAAFAVWLAYGLVLWRRQGRIAASVAGLERRRAWLRSLAWLLGGTAVALGLLAWVGYGGGVRNGRLEPWAMPVVVGAGLVFVHAQTVSALTMLVASMGSRTPPPPDTSEC